MAKDPSLARATRNARATRSNRRHYTPSQNIMDVAGVEKRSTECDDYFIGKKEDLIAAGLLADGMFPGDPGMPATSVVMYPDGVSWGSGENAAGRLQVGRSVTGKFTIKVAVSKDERATRRAEREARLQAVHRHTQCVAPSGGIVNSRDQWLERMRQKIKALDQEGRRGYFENARTGVLQGQYSAYLAIDVIRLVLQADEAAAYARSDKNFQRFLTKLTN